jgi:MHS family proline/betaine transporter-like MFS transporter
MDYDKDFDKSNINKVDPKAAKKTVFANWCW